MVSRRHLIVGAGYAGNGVAKAFKDAGIPYDHLERNDYVGGNWADGVYDSTHIISSRDSTQYGDYPMPRDYPDFPSREQIVAYLNDYVDEFGLRERIEFATEVVRCEPLDMPGNGSRPHAPGLAGWRVVVRLPDGAEEVRHYAGVVVANGHHWDKRLPDYPGEFTGATLHSKDYKRVADLAGDRVLVVGGGNSACDVAVEAAGAFGHAELSVRRGYWFLPKSFLGIPLAEWDKPFLPLWLQRRVIKMVARLTFGRYERYGLPEPDHRPFDKHPTVNSQLLYALRHGRVRARPDIARLDGRTVHFADGASAEYDTIVWATGFRVSFPFLDRDLFRWKGDVPVRVGSMLAPGVANLYVFGLLQPRGGAGPLITAGAQLLAEMTRVQERLDHPLADDLARFDSPSTNMLVGVSETMRRIAAARRFGLPAIRRLNQLRGRTLAEPPPLPANVRAWPTGRSQTGKDLASAGASSPAR
jgi:cation diffusion facilitator CzcD-associated flavoprotein CzcO